MKLYLAVFMKHIASFFKGIVIGISTLVPGVSGGTMAIVLGLYDKLISSISNFFKDIKNNIIFLGVLGVGAAVGVFGFSAVITYLLDNIRFVMIFLFLGIIIGGLPVLVKRAEINKITPKSATLFFVGAIIVVAMSLFETTVVNLASGVGFINMLFMVIAGFITAVALVLPGISGSFFLLTIGLYELTTTAVAERNLTYLLPFALGVALGIILTTKVIENLMKKYKSGTYIVILGFVAGSVIMLFIKNIPYELHIIFSILAFLAGFLITHTITKKSGESIV